MVAATAYDAISGFYERHWVTPASDNGVTHTIDARATDSAPNTAASTSWNVP